MPAHQEDPEQPDAMKDILIRPVAPLDAGAITAIYAPAVLHGTATFELDPPGTDEMLQRIQAITAAGFPYLVAERAGEVIGYAYANVYRSRPAYRFTVEDSVYVADHAQGQGVGRALLGALVDETAARGYRQMIAVIGDSRQWNSIALHRACGFTFAGTLHAVGYKFDRWIDSVLMQRRLGAGDEIPAP